MADKIPRPHKASVPMTARELAAVKELGEIWEHDKASTFRRAVREALAAELNRRVARLQLGSSLPKFASTADGEVLYRLDDWRTGRPSETGMGVLYQHEDGYYVLVRTQAAEPAAKE